MIAWLYWTSRLNVSFNFSDQDLSLLIQNKGSGSLSVAIAAPSFVKLEKTKIELQKKDEKKVHVNNNIFSLKAPRRYFSKGSVMVVSVWSDIGYLIYHDVAVL